jgi:hypothetical protein
MEENPSAKIPTTPEGREAYISNLAYHRAVEKLEKGEAKDSLIIAILRLDTEKARLERRKIEAEVKLADAKVSKIEADIKQEELYQNCIDAFRKYSGSNG